MDSVSEQQFCLYSLRITNNLSPVRDNLPGFVHIYLPSPDHIYVGMAFQIVILQLQPVFHCDIVIIHKSNIFAFGMAEPHIGRVSNSPVSVIFQHLDPWVFHGTHYVHAAISALIVNNQQFKVLKSLIQDRCYCLLHISFSAIHRHDYADTCLPHSRSPSHLPGIHGPFCLLATAHQSKSVSALSASDALLPPAPCGISICPWQFSP